MYKITLIGVNDIDITQIDGIDGLTKAVYTAKRLMTVFDNYKNWQIVITCIDNGNEYLRIKNSYVDGFALVGNVVARSRWLQ